MTGYGTATAEVEAALNAAGISAALDPASMDLPGVWITPATIDYGLMDGSEYFATWDLYLIGPDLDAVNALDHLSDLAGQVRGVFGEAVTGAQAVTMTSPNLAADGLPALLITLEMKVS